MAEVSAVVERLDWPRYLKHHDAFFACPRCGGKTLIRRGRLDMFNPPPSPFAADLQAAFGPVPAGLTPFDFACRRCGAPYRLLFFEQERGMGGPWDVSVSHVLGLTR